MFCQNPNLSLGKIEVYFSLVIYVSWDSALHPLHLRTGWMSSRSSLGWEDPLEEGKATHSSVLAWRIPWTEEWVGLQSIGSESQIQLKKLSTHTWKSNLFSVNVSLRIEGRILIEPTALCRSLQLAFCWPKQVTWPRQASVWWKVSWSHWEEQAQGKGLECVILSQETVERTWKKTVQPTRVLTAQVYQEFIFSYIMLPYFLGEIIRHLKKYILAFLSPTFIVNPVE